MRALWFALLAVATIGSAVAQDAPAPRTEAPAGEAHASIEVRPLEATVGDPLEVRLVVDFPSDAVSTLETPGPQIGPFTVLGGTWQEDPSAGKKRWTWTAKIAAYETGKLSLPSIEVQAAGPSGTMSASTEPIDVTIRSVLPASAAGAKEPELADLKPPASIPADFTVLKRALAIVLGLLALSALAWWLHRRYAAKLARVEAPEDPFRRVPPHVWAYEELKKLLERRLAEEGKIDLFFSELAHIVKQYLSGRFRLDLLERTTEEVAPLLAQAGAPKDPARAARLLLERCDLVKFARALPDAAECRKEIEEAYRIVDTTRPEEPRAAGDAA